MTTKSAIRTQPVEIKPVQRDRAFEIKLAAEGLRTVVATMSAIGKIGPARARAFAIAITSIEQAAFWAVNAITDDDDDEFVDKLGETKPMERNFVDELMKTAQSMAGDGR